MINYRQKSAEDQLSDGNLLLPTPAWLPAIHLPQPWGGKAGVSSCAQKPRVSLGYTPRIL